MRSNACLGTILMLSTSAFWYWLSQVHHFSRNADAKHTTWVYGLMATSLGNFGEGMTLVSVTSYLSL